MSESEWEYAARAGTIMAYYFDSTISKSQANFDRPYDGSQGGTVSVGSYRANTFGLHDMHGNVWEWVEDCWHGDYAGAPTDDSAWLSGCDNTNLRVLRGGSWGYVLENLRSAGRDWGFASSRDGYDGFRVARTLTP